MRRQKDDRHSSLTAWFVLQWHRLQSQPALVYLIGFFCGAIGSLVVLWIVGVFDWQSPIEAAQNWPPEVQQGVLVLSFMFLASAGMAAILGGIAKETYISIFVLGRATWNKTVDRAVEEARREREARLASDAKNEELDAALQAVTRDAAQYKRERDEAQTSLANANAHIREMRTAHQKQLDLERAQLSEALKAMEHERDIYSKQAADLQRELHKLRHGDGTN